MKKKITIAVMAIIGMMVAMSASAQTENGFKEFNVQDNFTENAFTYFTGAPILCAGDSTSCNAMTIGWGSIGNVWGMKRPTVTVYVAQKRYTHDFMERAKYFTVMEFADPNVAKYMGRNSGRNGDKAATLGLHVAYTKHGVPYYKEATRVLECEIMYGEELHESGFRNNVPRKVYANFPAGIHSIYIGEVIGAWEKK